MNHQSELSQFIYGKFVGRNCEYRLVAYTENLKGKEKELTNIAQRTFYFWGSQGTGTKDNNKAVGIIPYKENKLVLVQAAPGINENGQMLLSGRTKFEQHRYIFVPKERLNPLNNQTVSILIRLLRKQIPYFRELNVPGSPQPENGKSWWDVSDIFQPLSEDELSKTKVEQIHKCWSETDTEGQSFLLLALAGLLNQQRILLTIDQNTLHPVKFLESLLILLPAAYRTEIAIAAGALDEHESNWAKLIVKTNGKPKRPLPDSMVWLNRGGKKIIGESDKNTFEHQYVSDFISPIKDQADNILKFIQQLDNFDDENFGTLKNFTEPDFLVRLIPGLPDDQQINLWLRYLPKISNLKTVVESLSEDQQQICWKGCKQLYEQSPQTMLIVLKWLYDEVLLKILQNDLIQDLKLANTLIDANLLSELKDKAENPDISEALKQCCYRVIKYKFTKISTQQAWEFACKCITDTNLFPTTKEEFLVLDTALKAELKTDTFKKYFNQEIAPRIPLLDEANIRNSNFYIKLQKELNYVAEWIISLVQRKENSLEFLPQIADAMEMGYSQIDTTYDSFLNTWSPSYESAISLLISILEKSIENNGNFKLSLFPKTFQWFRQANSSLRENLHSLAKNSNHWNSWDNIAKLLYKDPVERIHFLERKFSQCFPDEILEVWLSLVSTDDNLKNEFMGSDIWLSLQKETLTKKLTAKPELAIIFANLATKSGRLELISENLLHHLTEKWISQKSVDRDMWTVLTSPTTLKFLTNQDWLKLWYVSWIFAPELNLPSNQTALNEQEKQDLYSYAIKLIDNFLNLNQFEQRRRLIDDCHDYGLAIYQIKQLAIKLIEVCNKPKKVSTLLKDCQRWNLNKSEQIEILIYAKPETYDKDLVIQLINIETELNGNNLSPLTNEEKRKIGELLLDYVSKNKVINELQEIAKKLISCKYLNQ